MDPGEIYREGEVLPHSQKYCEEREGLGTRIEWGSGVDSQMRSIFVNPSDEQSCSKWSTLDKKNTTSFPQKPLNFHLTAFTVEPRNGHSEEWTTSTKMLVPKVSIIRRFHCITRIREPFLPLPFHHHFSCPSRRPWPGC